MDATQQHRKWLLILLVINVIVTSFHYTDNFLDFDHYPAPTWMTQQSVYIAWIILTLIAAIGYFLYTKQNYWLAYICLIIYSITGGFSPGHYFYPVTVPFSFKMHTLIWLDAIAGITILLFTLWSALIVKHWQFKR